MSAHYGKPTEVEIASLKKTETSYNVMLPGSGTPWEDRGAIGVIPAFFKTAPRSLFKYRALVDQIRRPETTGEATAFALICGGLWAVSIAIWDAYQYHRLSDDGTVGLDQSQYLMETILRVIGAVVLTFVFLKVTTVVFYHLLSHDSQRQIPRVLVQNIFAYALGAQRCGAGSRFRLGSGSTFNRDQCNRWRKKPSVYQRARGFRERPDRDGGERLIVRGDLHRLLLHRSRHLRATLRHLSRSGAETNDELMIPADQPRRRSRLLARIRQRYQTRDQTLRLGGLTLEFTRIADPDRVLDDAAAAEQSARRAASLPAFPIGLSCGTALGLATWLASSQSPLVGAHSTLAGLSVLDLGCGMGLSGACAAALGARVTFADLETLPLLFARLNSLPWRHRIDARRVDWRFDTLGHSFDLILGADILYERSQWEFLDPFWRAQLRPAALSPSVSPDGRAERNLSGGLPIAAGRCRRVARSSRRKGRESAF